MSAQPPSLCGTRKIELLFVLAGAQDRKFYALDLLRRGLAPFLLFSVGRFEIRRFSKLPLPVPLDLLSLAKPIPPPKRHFFVYFENQACSVTYIKPRHFGTLTEILALRDWLAGRPEIASLMLISNRAHLRRIRYCCQFLLQPIPKWQVASPPTEFLDPENNDTLRTMAIELAKTAAYLPVLLLYRLRNRARPLVAHR